MARMYSVNMLCLVYFTPFPILCLFSSLIPAATDFTPHESLLFVGKGQGREYKNFAHEISSLNESVECIA